MKNLRRILPIILIIAPYLSVFVMVLPVRKTLPLYLLFSVVIYGFNIWNAWSYPHKEDGRSLAFWDMVIKLSHIPFYAGVFAMALLLMLAMVVPAFIIVTPILVSALAVVDVCLILTSSMYGISASMRLRKEGRISNQSALLYIILHLFFVTDVISAVCLYSKCRKQTFHP
ncbi:hypothetical protein GN277_11910 [Lachnospiraceae bacterium WCA-9-b2]|uniref:Uncharacterized protein n=1 Tax=Sporofaciens musculi TaxID=2681861 RepID=A0A7X3MGZ8_9FIRM|nr:hypothetical protein [Sporofaciens musculi]MXP76067.1 hypothetical protein [Sporofaciens musculi]